MERLYFPSLIKACLRQSASNRARQQLVSMTTTSVTCEIRLAIQYLPSTRGEFTPETVTRCCFSPLQRQTESERNTLCWRRKKKRTWNRRECVLLFFLCIRVSLTFMDCACYVKSVERCLLVPKRVLFLSVCRGLWCVVHAKGAG